MAFNAATSGSGAVVHCGLDRFKALGAILITVSHEPLAAAFEAFQ
jgi:hypothetical protein